MRTLNRHRQENVSILYKKNFLLLFAALLFLSSFYTPNRSPRFDAYVHKYHDLAIKYMVRDGIPASITLAQAILESDAGNSYLGIYANNHFGIKHKPDRPGDTILYPKDNKLYRKYESVEESYEDHSLFILQRPSYKEAFKLEIHDYEGWVVCLKKYAEDPEYGAKLLRIIKTYQLYKYDQEGLKIINQMKIDK